MALPPLVKPFMLNCMIDLLRKKNIILINQLINGTRTLPRSSSAPPRIVIQMHVTVSRSRCMHVAGLCIARHVPEESNNTDGIHVAGESTGAVTIQR